MPREHVDTLVNLAKLDFDHENWDSAASLYQTIIREHRATFDQIEEEDIRLHTASQSKRWFERSAYALAKTGKLEEALWVAEQGKARLLKRKLGWIDPQGQENVTLEERLGTLEVKPGTIILVPIVTPHGTLVLALANLGRATVLRGKFLPEITGDAVVQRISGGKRSDQVQGGWLGAYDKAFAPKTGEIRGAGDDWNAELREIQEWLGKQLVQPVFSWLHDIGIPIPSVVVWITQGELSILPIHAAVMLDGRPLVDHATIIYAPTLTFFERESLRLNRGHNRLRLVSIGNPTSDPKLPLSEVEAAASHSLVHGNSRMLTNADATRPAVKEALLAARVFHFAGHASFDREDPRQSYLLMAQRERLTVAELQNDSAASAPELVVLSACETGLIQVYDIANEFQGLPAAFLALGAQGVVSSLWPVKDGPALFLMYRFMQLRLTHGRDPASALREAQLWLRDAHGPDLAKVASRLGGLTRTETGKAFLSRMAWNFEHKPEWRPYSDPASWAGYVYAGRPM